MLKQLQRIGKSLMLPVAVLPAAAIIVRLGASDMLDIPFMAAAGDSLFKNLPLIFAIGIALGFAKDQNNNGGAALSGAIAYLVLTNGAKAINPDVDMSTFGGIFAGIVTGILYNKFYKFKLPEWLAFFGGRRFVPIVSTFTMIIFAFVFGYVWPQIQIGINTVAEWLLGLGPLGAGIYGVLNRLLIPFGLHHILNSYFFFNVGTFVDAAGNVVTGDIPRFLAGDPTAGIYQAGFFPIFMFGVPGIVAAFYTTAPKIKRKAIVGGLISMALTSILTGIAEPVEFTFMFIAFPLYVVHALFTGLSMFLANSVGILHGFGFSAGLFDYVLNFNLATNPLLIIPLGILMFFLYYGVFVWFIKKFDVKTPGREDEEEGGDTRLGDEIKITDRQLGERLINALGGSANIIAVENCATRLRLELKDCELVDESKMKMLGAKGFIKLTNTTMQIIIGLHVEQFTNAINEIIQEERN